MSPHRRQKIQSASVKWAVQWISVTVISFCALILTLGAPYIFGQKIQAGEAAQRDYVATQRTTVIDRVKTREAQEEARHHVLPVFRHDEKIDQLILSQLQDKLNEVQRLVQQNAASSNKDIDATAKSGKDDASATAVLLSPKEYPTWRAETEHAVERYLRSTDMLPESSPERWSRTLYEFLPDKYPDQLRAKTVQLIASILQPNVALDLAATKERAGRTIAHTKPITSDVDSGAVLIRKGERLNDEDVALLARMGITRTHDLQTLTAVCVALLAAFFLFGLFLYSFEPAFFFSPSAIALMATVCVVTCGIAAGVGREYAQFVPMPATALVLTVVFGRRVSVILALLVIVFLRVSDLVDGAHLVALTAATGVALGVNISRRNELMLAGVMIGLVQAIGYFVAVMFGGMPGSAMGVGKELAQNLLGGLSSSIVAIGSLPFLEMIFGILTPFRVAELSEPDQPLLRQLEEKAPGTYQHSLAVANLAEAGAKAIGADVNLVRAGAMYHDIGKMVTPRFFIENQLGDRNPHDDIAPEESRAKVLGHVTDGLVLARKYSLPKAVQDFIPEHQGTTIMAYFFHKACVRDGAENVNESDYRYPGPKPQSKETAIVMLADVSEAVTHSMHDPTQQEVETAIGNVFKARWDDGQFTESGLTEQETEKVKQAFVRVWRTLHHERLKYPATTTGRMPVPPNLMPASSPAGTNSQGPANSPNSNGTGTNEATSTSEMGAPAASENQLSQSPATPPLPPGADCC